MRLRESDYYNILAYALYRGEPLSTDSNSYMFTTRQLTTVIVRPDRINLVPPSRDVKLPYCIYEDTFGIVMQKCPMEVCEDIYDTLQNIDGAYYYSVKDIGSIMAGLVSVLNREDMWDVVRRNECGVIRYKRWVDGDTKIHYIPSTNTVIAEHWKFKLQYSPKCSYWQENCNVLTNILHFRDSLYELHGLHGCEYYINKPWTILGEETVDNDNEHKELRTAVN